MADTRTAITTPVGRIVMGSLYEPMTKDIEGRPLVVKNGPNAGQPRVQYFIALAVPKGAEQHWAYTEWGKPIWEVGCRAFPQASQAPTFAWKIEDGDSLVPNQKGRVNANTEGYKGNWILKLSGGFVPKLYREENGAFVAAEPIVIKPGHLVQVRFTVDGNETPSKPGVYLNLSMVCFRGYHPNGEITFGENVNEVGFGAAPLPAGALLAPPALPLPMPAAPAIPSGLPPAPALPVVPQPGFLQMPPPSVPIAAASGASPMLPVPALPVAPIVPPVALSVPVIASPSKTMTAKAQGASYQAFISAGWTDANLIAQGYLQP